MKDIEVNSDKHTVLLVCFALVPVLIMFLSSLYGVLTHGRVAHSNLGLGTYVGAFLVTCLAVLGLRDKQLLGTYRYGIAGACGMAAWWLIVIAMHWTRASAESQNFAGTILRVLNIVVSGLVLVEGIRWFKKTVRLGADV
jgi:hypothetical protein